MSLLSYLRHLSDRLHGRTKRQIEIRRVECAVMRYRQELQRMMRSWADNDGVCCPSCAYGSTWSYYETKLERAQAVLKRLKTRV